MTSSQSSHQSPSQAHFDESIEGTEPDWLAIANQWGFAHGQPLSAARLKDKPEDFRVNEILNIEFSGEGEHIWLQIEKTSLNSSDVIRALATFANIKQRDIGYSGMKDKHAVTTQWFSLWMPAKQDPDWTSFAVEGVRILRTERHNRKLRVATHSHNEFLIKAVDVDVDPTKLVERIERIQQFGVPNYFGMQRFGYQMANLSRAYEYYSKGEKVRDKRLKGLLLSSARSWLFNNLLATRVADGSWDKAEPNERVVLDGSNSFFIADESGKLNERLVSLDIHPSCPLAGEGIEEFSRLDGGDATIKPKSVDQVFVHALKASGMSVAHRATRIKVNQFSVSQDDNSVIFSFRLLPGQFATSVIREVLSC